MEGKSLREVCRSLDIPPSNVMFWLKDYPEFAEQYARAREIGWSLIAEELLEISDDGTNDWMERLDQKGQSLGWQINGEAVQRSRIRLDTRKWLLSKMLPKIYGDKVDVEHSGTVSVNIVRYGDGNAPK